MADYITTITTRLQAGETPVAIAADLELDMEEDADDGDSAAQEYVDGGEWGEVEETEWVHVWTWRTGLRLEDGDITEVELARESHTVALEPEEPECTHESGDHDWASPYRFLGGLKENPGVWGNGGGVVYKEICLRCGATKTTDTWAQDPSTGIQGLTSVRYEAPDTIAIAHELSEDAGWDWVQEADADHYGDLDKLMVVELCGRYGVLYNGTEGCELTWYANRRAAQEALDHQVADLEDAYEQAREACSTR